MPREASKWIEDILTHGNDALEFIEGQSEENYLNNKALRAMVERKLFIVGEAVSQPRAWFPEIAESIPHTRDIIGFRNRFAQGYFALVHQRVYEIATLDLPELLDAVKAIDTGDRP